MKQYQCTIEITLGVIGGKWKTLLLYHLLDGPKRTSELKRQIPGITQKMLTQQLRELESDGVVHRKSYNQVPPKVEYSLTDHGLTLEPILRDLCKWGMKHLEYSQIAEDIERVELAGISCASVAAENKK
ncbi:MAG: winged helix-turn-helix transcriptional regulator [Rubrobacteridae bacterium]|nr:winged helix-turn-helix transcriptional regulator [Rubrobacteridae bacterium]